MTDHLKGHPSLAEMVSTHIASFREALKCIRGDVLEVVNGDYWQHELNALSDIEKACAIEAARATAEQRDSVIEECAKVCEKIADLLKTGSVATAVETAEGCASEIRALKSQQDAAIESQRSGDGS